MGACIGLDLRFSHLRSFDDPRVVFARVALRQLVSDDFVPLVTLIFDAGRVHIKVCDFLMARGYHGVVSCLLL